MGLKGNIMISKHQTKIVRFHGVVCFDWCFHVSSPCFLCQECWIYIQYLNCVRFIVPLPSDGHAHSWDGNAQRLHDRWEFQNPAILMACFWNHFEIYDDPWWFNQSKKFHFVSKSVQVHKHVQFISIHVLYMNIFIWESIRCHPCPFKVHSQPRLPTNPPPCPFPRRLRVLASPNVRMPRRQLNPSQHAKAKDPKDLHGFHGIKRPKNPPVNARWWWSFWSNMVCLWVFLPVMTLKSNSSVSSVQT